MSRPAPTHGNVETTSKDPIGAENMSSDIFRQLSGGALFYFGLWIMTGGYATRLHFTGTKSWEWWSRKHRGGVFRGV